MPDKVIIIPTYLRRHDKKGNKQIPNGHINNQKVKGAFHPSARSHYVDYGDVAEEAKDEDSHIKQCHPGGSVATFNLQSRNRIDCGVYSSSCGMK